MNGRRRFLLGTVLSIQNSSFIYPACQNCCSRLILTSCRYECDKCGSAYKEAAHRYKLCVKVSEERWLHVITIFGKCLEKIFGASADSLHSQLQVSSQLSGDLEHDKAQELLLQAAERCLIGRSFIFAVRIPETFDRSDFISYRNLQQNVVACQIILLHEDPMSCTVLSCYNQMVESIVGGAVQTKTNVSAADTTNQDLSDLGFSESSLHQSWNHYADYWQKSLGLVSSPVSDTISQSDCGMDGQEPSLEAVTPPNTTLCIQGTLNSTEVVTPSSSISTPSVKCSTSKPIPTNTRSPPRSPHFHSFPSKIKSALGQESYLLNVCKSGSRRSQSCSELTIQLPPQTAEIHQAKEEIWEDFPFSESLSEFIAKIEGMRPDCTAIESKTVSSKEENCKRSCDLMNFPAIRRSQNYTDLKEASHCSFDKNYENESNMCVSNLPCNVTRRDDTGIIHLKEASHCSFDNKSKMCISNHPCKTARREDTGLIDLNEAAHCSFDKYSSNESNTPVFNQPCRVTRTDNTSIIDMKETSHCSFNNESNMCVANLPCKVSKRDNTGIINLREASHCSFESNTPVFNHPCKVTRGHSRSIIDQRETSHCRFDKCSKNNLNTCVFTQSCKVTKRANRDLMDQKEVSHCDFHQFSGNELNRDIFNNSRKVARRDGRGLIARKEASHCSFDNCFSNELTTCIFNHPCKFTSRDSRGITDQKEASHCSFDKLFKNISRSCTFTSKVTSQDDTSLVFQAFPPEDLSGSQKSSKNSHLNEVLSRVSTKDQQSSTYLKVLSNGTSFDDSLDLGSMLEDLDKSAVSWGRKFLIHGGEVFVNDEPKSSKLDMAKVTSEVKSVITGDIYNASADLFEASNNPEDDGTFQSQHIGPQNRGQRRLLVSITDSPCSVILPYQHRESLSENYETQNNLSTRDFFPFLQSTPVLGRISEARRLSVDFFSMTSNAKSSTVSIRTRSSSTIRPMFFKNMRKRKSGMFYGLSENDLLCSPNLSPFFGHEGSTTVISRSRRTLLAHQARKGRTVLENTENCDNTTQGCNHLVERSDCRNTGGEGSIKHGGDTMDNMENLSPVKGEDQLFLGDWSPELFSGTSNISQPSDSIQRRLF